MDNCVICKKPILGYYYGIKKNMCVCAMCAATTTIAELGDTGAFELLPKTVYGEIVENNGQALLVTNTSDELPPDEDYEDIYYTNEDITAFGQLIAEIKAHGCNSEHEFLECCRLMREDGVSEEDNELLVLRKKYMEMVPMPRFEGDDGNDTWDAMYAQWENISDVCKLIGITRDELIAEVKAKVREYEGDNVDIPPEDRDMYFGYACNDVAKAHGISPDTILDIYTGVMHTAKP